VRGCTKISYCSDQVWARRTRPSGSPSTVVTGPTGITPRRAVGTTNSSSTVSPERRRGVWNTAAERPTGNSTRTGRLRRLARLRRTIDPAARSPTTTRAGSTVRSDPRSSRPIVAAAAVNSSTRHIAAMRSNSRQSNTAPTTHTTAVITTTARPRGVTAPQIAHAERMSLFTAARTPRPAWRAVRCRRGSVPARR
jgi:hypothetical protein